MLLIILAFLSFYPIAEDYAANGWLSSMDRNAAEFFRHLITPRLTRAVLFVTFFGSVGAVITVSVIVAIVLILKREMYRFSAFALTTAGGRVLTVALKYLFQRARPAPENPIVTYVSYSFPERSHDGHNAALRLSCYYGSGISKRLRKTRRVLHARRSLGDGNWRRGSIWAAHYLTDVTGGFTAGLAWLAVCWTAVESLHRWRMRHDSFPRPVFP